MSIKSGLVSLLTGEATVSTHVASRVYINKAPQGAAYPHIILTQLGSDEMNALDSTSNLRSVEFDVDIKAQRSLTADTVAKAVRVFLDDYSGTAGSETIGAVIYNSESDFYEPPADGSDLGVFGVTLNCDIHYNPA